MHKPYFVSGVATVIIGMAFAVFASVQLGEIELCESVPTCYYVEPGTNNPIPTSPHKAILTYMLWAGVASSVVGLGQAVYGYSRHPLPGEPTLHRLHKFTAIQRKSLGWIIVGLGLLEIGYLAFGLALRQFAEEGPTVVLFLAFALLAIAFGYWCVRYRPPLAFDRDAPQPNREEALEAIRPPPVLTPRAAPPPRPSVEPGVATSAGPVETLKMRFARGEITSTQFQHARQLLEE